MIGVFILKSKYFSPKNDPKKLLKLQDEELVGKLKTTPKITYFLHHKDDFDSLSDIEKIESTQKYWDENYLVTLKKVRGVDNAYQNEDGSFYIKVLTKDNEWFKRYF